MGSLDKALIEQASALLPDIIALRRAIHAEPELGLHTPKTIAKVRAALADLPLEYREGPSSSGLVAVLRGTAPGPTVLLRGDMDALPMQEDTGLAFSSQVEGAMHACGHDSHTAMLAGAARLLCARREHLAGTVLFMFQPGEEGFHGARLMMDDGLLEPKPDAAFALHIMPNGQHGVFGSRSGPLMASNTTLEIDVRGRGGHASMPHDALDPIPVACEIVTAMQALVTRRVNIFDPAVITIAKISAGTTDNVIPETAHLLGTLRTLSRARRDQVLQDLARLVEGIAGAHGASAELKVELGFPVTICDAGAVALSKKVVQNLYGTDAWLDLQAPIMGAEDFSYVLEETPGAMVFLGAAQEGTDWRQCCGLHSNRMQLDEAVMARGTAVHAAFAETFLRDGFAV